MKAYLDLVRHILDVGTRKENRTGVDTISTFNYNYEHDLATGFPLLTTKKISWKNIVIENLWFLSGERSIKLLQKHGIRFWDPWVEPNDRMEVPRSAPRNQVQGRRLGEPTMNKVSLHGYLGADPELRYTQGGNAVCSASLCTTRRWTDARGQKQEEASWHRLTIWGKTGEAFAKWFHKGSEVLVEEGRLHYGSYEDKDKIKRYTTDIIVERWGFCGGRKDSDGAEPRSQSQSRSGSNAERPAPSQRQAPQQNAPASGDDLPMDDFTSGGDEDIPF